MIRSFAIGAWVAASAIALGAAAAPAQPATSSAPTPTSLAAASVQPAPSPAAAATAAPVGGSATPASPPAQSTPNAEGTPGGDDPYLWLEDVHGARATAWVNAENAKTLGVLEADPRYPKLYADALAVAQAKDRIAYPTIIGGRVWNFWQDAGHVRGIWRSTTLAGYRRSSPAWTTALDLDALAKAEHANWVWEGASCAWPREERCLISLSDGGEDARTVREFDLRTHAFVQGGFTLPRGKQDAVFENRDTLLVARAWQPGELTASGYPYVVKRLRRGRPLASAVEIFRGTKRDVAVNATVLDDEVGDHLEIIDRGVSFFQSEKYLLTVHGPQKLAIPLKASIENVIAGRLLISLAEDWTTRGAVFKAGSLVAIDVKQLQAHPQRLTPALVYAPGPRDSLSSVATTRTQVMIAINHNVRGRAFVYTLRPGGGWAARRLDLPDNASIDIVATDPHGDTGFLSVESFLTPTTLWLAQPQIGVLTIVKALPARFDAANDTVEQREATSTDGTRVPYFIVHPKRMRLDGSNPTILYAYGGFAISETPTYSGITGKLWLERGGVYVLANIRGGGEFGPAWHEAGLTIHRQRVYDDFAAVARALIADRVTDRAHLGIQGGSNGGLLMGVEFTQHPELFGAVDMQVPLLDMLRFEQIAAGASWVGEYGSVAIPEQRAFLAKISPYNTIKRGVNYPEPFIWTTTKDDRVGPQHARKFAARLAEYGIPYLFYEVTEGGHGAGANLKERARTAALQLTYFSRKLMPDSDP